MRFHMLQNAQMALDFLRYKKIKLVNIRAEDIVDGNPKLTLGLIWTIILHFQVCRSNRIQLLQIVAYISSLTSAWNSSSLLRALIDLTLRAVAAQPGAQMCGYVFAAVHLRAYEQSRSIALDHARKTRVKCAQHMVNILLPTL